MKHFYLPLAAMLALGAALLPGAAAQTTVSTLAGSGQAGPNDGPAPSAQFNNLYGVARDALGSTYVTDAFNHLVRKISPAGAVTTIGGTGNFGYSNSSLGVAAAFNDPKKLVADAAGNIYVADTGNDSIRRIDGATGAVTTFAGSGQSGYVDGPAATARFESPTELALDPATGGLYVADTENHRIRRVDATGGATTTPATRRVWSRRMVRGVTDKDTRILPPFGTDKLAGRQPVQALEPFGKVVGP